MTTRPWTQDTYDRFGPRLLVSELRACLEPLRAWATELADGDKPVGIVAEAFDDIACAESRIAAYAAAPDVSGNARSAECAVECAKWKVREAAAVIDRHRRLVAADRVGGAGS